MNHVRRHLPHSGPEGTGCCQGPTDLLQEASRKQWMLEEEDQIGEGALSPHSDLPSLPSLLLTSHVLLGLDFPV